MAEGGWQKREQGTFVKIGDGDGQVKTAQGLLTEIRPGNYDNLLYNLVQQDGEIHTVPGSSSIDNSLGSHDVGEFIKLEFTGWGESKSGRKFKMIEVHVWRSEYTDEMKAWPRFKDFHGPNGKQKSLDEKPDAIEEAEEEDDALPF